MIRSHRGRSHRPVVERGKLPQLPLGQVPDDRRSDRVGESGRKVAENGRGAVLPADEQGVRSAEDHDCDDDHGQDDDDDHRFRDPVSRCPLFRCCYCRGCFC